MKPPSYLTVHETLLRDCGPARLHLCHCGEPASDWAYQFTGETLTAPDGSRPHSTDPDDYEAMCRSCHIRFDMEHDPMMAEKRRAGGADGRAKVNEGLAERRKTDPEFVDRMNEVLWANLAVQAECLECGLTSTRPGIGNHQKHTRHTGRKELG